MRQAKRPFPKRKPTDLTSRQVKDLLPLFLHKMGKQFLGRQDLLIAAWPEVVGERVASMTQVQKLEDGVLYVCVKNSTLYSLLCGSEKYKIMRMLNQRFPKTRLDEIRFRIG